MIRNFKSPNPNITQNSPARSSQLNYPRSNPIAQRNYLSPDKQLKSSGYKNKQWEDQSQHQQSSTVYHMNEQIRLLKLKNCHLEEHMDRMQIEYEQLRKVIELFEINEKEQLRRNNQLVYRINGQQSRLIEMKNEIEITRLQNQELKADSKTSKYREQQLRRRIDRLKQSEFGLNGKIEELQRQNEQLKSRNNEKQRNTARKKEEINSIQKQLEETQEELKNKNEKYVMKIKKLEGQNAELNKRIEQLEGVISQKVKIINQKEGVITEKEESIREREKTEEKLRDFLRIKEGEIQTIKKEKIEISEQKQSFQKQLQNAIQAKTEQISLLELAYEKKMKEVNEKLLKKDEEMREMLISHQQKQHEEIATNERNRVLMLDNQKNMENLICRANQLETQKQKMIQEMNELKEKLNVEQLKIKEKEAEYAGFVEKQEKNKELLSILNFDETDQSLSDLEKQYDQQLQALRRLILYKKYPNASETTPNNVYVTTSSTQKEDRIRQQYQRRIDSLVKDYQKVQQQLLTLQQEVIQKHHNSPYDLVTFRTSEEERELYMQAVRKWQIAFEEQQAIYQAKLTSKDEHINLLNLKLANRD